MYYSVWLVPSDVPNVAKDEKETAQPVHRMSPDSQGKCEGLRQEGTYLPFA